jgi:ABC-type uncharacterized transport system substrate-binding protein
MVRARSGRQRAGGLYRSRYGDQHAPNLAAMRQVASHEGLAVLPFYAAVPEDYPGSFAAMRRAEASALQIVSAPQFFANASTLVELALKARFPTMCEWRSMAAQGCLLGYGPDYTELQRQCRAPPQSANGCCVSRFT